MIEQEIINRVFARKPFTAIEIVTNLYPKKQSEYSKISNILKSSYFEISEYYDNMEIDVVIQDEKQHKKTVSQTLYYPWEYNPRNYKKEFIFDAKHLSDNSYVFTPSNKIKEYEIELDDEIVGYCEKEEVKPVVKEIKPVVVKEVKKPVVSPFRSISEDMPRNEYGDQTVKEIKPPVFHEKTKSIQDTVIIKNIVSEKEDVPKLNENNIVINNNITIEHKSVKVVDDNITITNNMTIKLINEKITDEIKTENQIIKSEQIKPTTEIAVNNIQVSKIHIAPVKKAITSIGEFTLKQTEYKKEVILLRTQAKELGIDDLNYSISCSNKRIILNVQENGPLQSDGRGLKINKSFLDLAGLSGNVNVTVFSDKSLMYTQA